MTMYKGYDFRCLKPKAGVPSEKWPHYEMQAFRAAKTKEELKKVEEIPFDNYFFNFEDPEVLTAFTDGSDKGLELWKRTYGFDWADWDYGKKEEGNSIKVQEHCLQAEYSSFAQDCKENGGFFKCCQPGFRLDQFHLIRYELKKRNLIENGPKHLYCGNRWSGDKDGFCYIAAGREHTFITM